MVDRRQLNQVNISENIEKRSREVLLELWRVANKYPSKIQN